MVDLFVEAGVELRRDILSHIAEVAKNLGAVYQIDFVALEH